MQYSFSRTESVRVLLFRFLCSLFIISALVFASFVSAQVVYAQSAGDVVITEVMYEPLSGGDWVEVYNAGSASVTMTGLKIAVGNTEYTISTNGSTTASLAVGDTAVVAADPSGFTTAYSYGTTHLYKAAGASNAVFSLPAVSNTTVKVKKNATDIDSITYSRDSLAERTGSSLHKTLGNIFVPAPATPKELASNPVTDTAARQVGSSVSTGITGGTKVAGDDARIYLGQGDTITLTVLDQKSLGTVTAKVLIGTAERTVTLSGDGTRKTGTYTVTSSDPSGFVTYSVTGLTDSAGAVVPTTTGSVYGEGRIAVVDVSAPTVTTAVTTPGVSTRKVVTVTVRDDSPPDTISYRISSSSCGTKSTYDASTDTEAHASLSDSGTAEIRLFGTEYNNKYLCVKASDVLDQTTYAVSSKITGLTTPKLVISEIMYRPATGKTEWIEITNVGTDTVVLTDYVIDDGGTKRSLTVHTNSSANVAPGAVAIVAKAPATFKTEFSGYRGPLVKGSISLLDTKPETVGIRKKSDNTLLDTITYTRSDGAYDKNGKTLHITNSGSIFEANATPGVKTAGQGGGVITPGKQKEVFPTDSLARVSAFGDGSVAVATGQNLFFTKDNSVDISFTLSDDSTQYTTGTVSTYLDLKHSASVSSNDYRVTQKSVAAGTTDGTVVVTYTVYFSPSSGTPVADNRVTVYPKLKDGDDNYNTKRASVVIVRDTTAPALTNSGSMSVLGFSSGSNVIVPVTTSGIAVGDWISLSYSGTCGNGLLSYIARNGGHGLYYEVDPGTYSDCTVSGTDSAGNVSTALSLPRIIVASAGN